MAANTSGRFAADVGYKKRPKTPRLPLAGEPRKKPAKKKKR